jgi:hypothetical protein
MQLQPLPHYFLPYFSSFAAQKPNLHKYPQLNDAEKSVTMGTIITIGGRLTNKARQCKSIFSSQTVQIFSRFSVVMITFTLVSSNVTFLDGPCAICLLSL